MSTRPLFYVIKQFFGLKMTKNAKKCKKIKKNAKKICIYQKKAVPLHQISKRKSRNTKQ